MLKILAHRGAWTHHKEQNSVIALRKALQQGWGIEFDIRDERGELVISHDIPSRDSTPLDRFLAELTEPEKRQCFAVNVKADGLAEKLRDLLNTSVIQNYFVFDMSVPDTRSFLSLNMPVYTRLSEEEDPPAFITSAVGIWLDSFTEKGVDLLRLGSYLQAIAQPQFSGVALVSPELHGLPWETKWSEIRAFLGTHVNYNVLDIYLCTDKPALAAAFFGSK